MSSFTSMSSLFFLLLVSLSVICLVSGVQVAPSIDLGRCSVFSIQAGTAVSANGVLTTIATGSVGVAPGSAITGNIVLQAGAIEANSPAAINCAADMLGAYAAAKAASCPANQTLPADLAGLTLQPGVYCSAPGFWSISASTLTLDSKGDANAVWIFQAATTLTTATATSFILQNGAQAKNVFWQLGSSASIGYSSSFVGTILAYASVSFDHDAVIVGRAMAQAAVTFAGGDSVTLPAGSFVPPSYNLSVSLNYDISSINKTTYTASMQTDLAAALSVPVARIPLSSFSTAAGSVVTSFTLLPPTMKGSDVVDAAVISSSLLRAVNNQSETVDSNSMKRALKSGSVTAAVIDGSAQFLLVINKFAAVSAPDLARCASFAVMAGTAASADGVVTTLETGNVGVAPGTAINGNFLVKSGSKELNSQAAIDCAADNLVAYAEAKGAYCPPSQNLTSSDLAGLTLTPGVYCTASGFFTISASTLTLDAMGDANAVWIFQAATTVTTATATSFILQNGAVARNVFWQLGTSASIGYSSSFVGTILAYASVSFDHDAVLLGRALAQAAVTFAGGDSVTLPVSSGADPLPASSSSSTGGAAGAGSTSSSSTATNAQNQASASSSSTAAQNQASASSSSAGSIAQNNSSTATNAPNGASTGVSAANRKMEQGAIGAAVGAAVILAAMLAINY